MLVKDLFISSLIIILYIIFFDLSINFPKFFKNIFNGGEYGIRTHLISSLQER